MRLGRAADHSPPSSAAVMEEESYTSTQTLGHAGPVTGSLYLYTFYKASPLSLSVKTEAPGDTDTALSTEFSKC